VKVKEEMDSLKRALQDASRERDKAVQDLARLKQHLLDKVTIYWYLYFSCIFCSTRETRQSIMWSLASFVLPTHKLCAISLCLM
jgi:hypothetical protein